MVSYGRGHGMASGSRRSRGRTRPVWMMIIKRLFQVDRVYPSKDSLCKPQPSLAVCLYGTGGGRRVRSDYTCPHGDGDAKSRPHIGGTMAFDLSVMERGYVKYARDVHVGSRS